MQIDIKQNILEYNDKFAAENKRFFNQNKILTFNFISSPGSGKTTLMEKTAIALKDKYRLAFLVGDIETERDAERIRRQGVTALQLTTGGACHLEAPLIDKGVKSIKKQQGDIDILFIENVGNLVCPSSFDLGENIRVVMVSTPEGDDKPAKYPKAFHTSQVFIISKIDIKDFFDFDVEKIKKEALSLNPKLKIFEISSKTGQGMDKWFEYIESVYSNHIE